MPAEAVNGPEATLLVKDEQGEELAYVFTLGQRLSAGGPGLAPGRYTGSASVQLGMSVSRHRSPSPCRNCSWNNGTRSRTTGSGTTWPCARAGERCTLMGLPPWTRSWPSVRRSVTGAMTRHLQRPDRSALDLLRSCWRCSRWSGHCGGAPGLLSPITFGA